MQGWIKSFAIFSIVIVYHVTEAIQVLVGTHSSWCTDMFCIASICVWFENCSDKHSLIQELLLYEAELGHITVEAIKKKIVVEKMQLITIQ